MLIKICSRRTESFHQLARYINHEATVQPLCVNFPQTDNPKLVAQAFKQNLKYKPKRIRNTLYHSVISFKDKVTQEILEDTALQFLKLSGIDRHLAYVGFHTNHRNPHIHIMSSSNAYRSKENFRLSKSELRQLQIDMELYQQREYPQLRHSLIYTKKDRVASLGFTKAAKLKEKKTDAEVQIAKRGIKTKKEHIIETITSIATSTSSLEEFKKALEQHHEIQSYSYRGKINGVMYQNKKYRLKTLLQTKDLNQLYKQLKYKTKNNNRDRSHEQTR